jgi:hypothetical protein
MAERDSMIGEAGLAGWDDGGGAELDGCVAVGAAVELGELVVGAGEADLEAFDLAEPAFPLRLGDAGEQVVADLLQARSLRWLLRSPGLRTASTTLVHEPT